MEPFEYEIKQRAHLIKIDPETCARAGLLINSRKLGGGAYGTVWTTDNPHFVVKMTSSNVEAINVRKILRQHITGVVFYDSIDTIKVNDEEFYDYTHLIRMEKLNTPPEWIHELSARYGMPGKLKSQKQKRARWEHSKSKEERRFFQQIEFAWLMLKKMGVIHRDVHTGNIMCDKDGKFKLIDAM